jgi:hypothetical protein
VNFAKSLKVVCSDLEHFCKIYEIIKKNRKRKEAKKRKI